MSTTDLVLQVVSASLNVLQVVALTYIAARWGGRPPHS